MAKKSKKTLEVQKFGGIDDHGTVNDTNSTDFYSELGQTKYIRDADTNYDLKSIETESTTKLEEDVGYGNAVIIRMFEFRVNPLVFYAHSPTKQELFNSHYKGIEIALWKDGMKVIPEVDPRIVVNEAAGTYQIFVGAAPAKGHILKEQPQTLSQLVHGGNN